MVGQLDEDAVTEILKELFFIKVWNKVYLYLYREVVSSVYKDATPPRINLRSD